MTRTRQVSERHRPPDGLPDPVTVPAEVDLDEFCGAAAARSRKVAAMVR